MTRRNAAPALIACTFAILTFTGTGEAANSSEPLAPTNARFKTSFEEVTLPGGEHMGFLGGQFLYDLAPWLSFGPAGYGALTGERGGFITLGIAADVHYPLTDWLSANAGYFVGAGGGRGGYTLSGGGLMLRSHAGLDVHMGRWGILGAGVSHLDFPNGHIESPQPFVAYSYPFNTLLSSGWSMPGSSLLPSADTLAANEQEFAIVLRHYEIPGSVETDAGEPQNPTLQLVGAEWLTYLNDNAFLKIEGEGANGGDSQGYMQVFFGGGYRFEMTRSTALKLAASAGVAGGGAVDTGGGLLVDAQVSLQQMLSERLYAEFGVSYVDAPQASFKAASLAAKLGYRFGIPDVGDGPVSLSQLDGYRTRNLRFRFIHQRYIKADPNWRSHHADLNVDNLGVAMDYFPHSNLYLTGQGIAAYDGEAGAYMAGLLGGGLHTALFGTPFYAEIEALAGAAGGGGLDVNGGLVWQANANLGYQFTDQLGLSAGVGRMEAPKGNYRANVVGLGVIYRFGVFVREE